MRFVSLLSGTALRAGSAVCSIAAVFSIGAALCGAAVVTVSLTGHAHPNHGPGDSPHDDGGQAQEISDRQKQKRLERVIRQAERRQRNVAQRSTDRRRHLRKRLGRHLKGADLTPELVKELELHAERTAMLRQIRYIAAMEKDYDTVVASDKLLARQNSSHEHWWRTVLRAARTKTP